MVYRLVYGFFYGISLLPWFLIYGLSDICFLLLAYVIRYRRTMMLEAIKRSFPGKTDTEHRAILRRFYRNFSDTWFEMIKIMSMSEKTLRKMVETDFAVIADLHKRHSHIQVFTGHFMNWELYQAALCIDQPYELRGIYMPVKNKIFDRMVYKLRGHFGTVLVPATNQTALSEQLRPLPGTSFLTAVVADQSPPNLQKASWLYFLEQPTAFMNGPWQRMCNLNQPVVYINTFKIKRGRYRITAEILEEFPAAANPADMLRKYVGLVETTIQNNPAIYLWSHRRWKIKFNPQDSGAPWIDPRPAPGSTNSGWQHSAQ